MLDKFLFLFIILFLSSCNIYKNEAIIVDKSHIDCTNDYIVKTGDKLILIAWQCNLNVDLLAMANNLNRPYVLKIGQKLTLNTDNVLNINISKEQTNKEKSTVSVVKAKNSYKGKTKKKTKFTDKEWVYPVDAKIIEKFSFKKSKLGIKFATKNGQTVKAVRDGVVAYSGDKMLSHGKMIIIKHPFDIYSAYTQNKILKIKSGDEVLAGEPIAVAGNKPFYFEMRKQSKPVDPLSYIK